MKRQQVQAGKRTYIVGERLGRGASGQVYEAWRKGSKKRLALKVVPNDSTSHKAHLRSEIEALEVLSRHESVVSLHHYGLDEQSNVWFLELEYAAGGDMLKRIETGGLSEDEVRPIAYDIFSAITFAHSNGFCHRDIKLESM
jgi:eukaryotic-like serine/threonine-protein kinase